MRAPAPVEVVGGAAERLPFSVAALVLCPVDDQRAQLREIHRVLRPGGRLWLPLRPGHPPGDRRGRVHRRGPERFLFPETRLLQSFHVSGQTLHT
ncbi:class I SAM-dependent methyltransferase [Nocardiopsis sp. CNT312]|uniref:class I SAM-dependent methyltransferase n=1 Tax=Nocardiopsis sp. CNT312 TaxID=1137268 RepID=UPI0004918ED2|nr:methyltransferase domain-containing protein [Nocardiopsis sp. CNT312]